jgi:hypothetical protein
MLSHAALLIWILTAPGVDQAPAVSSDKPKASVTAESRRPVSSSSPQRDAKAGADGREIYVSWGYNGNVFSSSDMHFSQPSLNSDFTLTGVQARDSKGWNSQFFTHGLFVPQYNIRLGVFFNDKWGAEIALDHIKWIVRQDQQVRMTGTRNGAPVDATVTLSTDVLRYQLNNGANPIFFNIIRRVHVAGTPGRTGHVSVMAKAGAGFAVPHTENFLFGQMNDDGFQPFHGWDLDAGAAIRVHLFRPLYFEFEEKLVYARYFGVKIDQGKASHSMKSSEYVWNFGLSFR